MGTLEHAVLNPRQYSGYKIPDLRVFLTRKAVLLTSNVDKNILLYTEDGLKESRNICKYRYNKLH